MKNRSQSGNTLFVVLFVVAVLSIFAGAAFNYTSGTANVSQRSTQMTLGYGVADAAMEVVFSRWRAIVSSYTNKNLNAAVFVDPSGTPNYNAVNRDITRVSLSDLNLPAGYLGLTNDVNAPLGKITIQTVDVFGRLYGTYDATGRCTDPPTTLINSENRNTRSGAVYPPVPSGPDYVFRLANPLANGFEALNIVYSVTVQLDVPSRAGNIPVGVKRLLTRSVASAAQAALFFENRLEVLPGTNMTVLGRVHSNEAFFQGTRGSTELTFLKRVSYVPSEITDYDKDTTQGGSNQAVQVGYIYNDTNLNSTHPLYAVDTDRFRADGGLPVAVPPMVVGGIERDYLKPWNNTAQNLNNNSLRELIERPVLKTAGAYSASAAFDSVWDVPTTGEDAKFQAAIEAARLYNLASLKIVLVYDSATGLLDLTRSEFRKGNANQDAADGELLNGSSSTSDEQTLRLDVLKALNPVYDSAGVLQPADATGGKRTIVNDNREQAGGSGAVATTVLQMTRLRDALKKYKKQTGLDLPVVYIADVTGQDTKGSYNNGAYTGAVDFEGSSGATRVKHAVMIRDAEELPNPRDTEGGTFPAGSGDGTFTLASENAVYVRGDYNIGGVPTGGARPTVDDATTDPRPAMAGLRNHLATSAIMADAVAMLSNKFDPAAGYREMREIAVELDGSGNPVLVDNPNYDSSNPTDPTNPAKFPKPLWDSPDGGVTKYPRLARGAPDTTMNAGIVTGIYANTADTVGGGASNLLRFMENWRLTSTPINMSDVASWTVSGGPQLSFSGNTIIYGGEYTISTALYTGSIMQSFYSKEFNQRWVNPRLDLTSRGRDYGAPIRSIQFDTTMLTKPPVGFPGTISYSRGAWQRF